MLVVDGGDGDEEGEETGVGEAACLSRRQGGLEQVEDAGPHSGFLGIAEGERFFFRFFLSDFVCELFFYGLFVQFRYLMVEL